MIKSLLFPSLWKRCCSLHITFSFPLLIISCPIFHLKPSILYDPLGGPLVVVRWDAVWLMNHLIKPFWSSHLPGGILFFEQINMLVPINIAIKLINGIFFGNWKQISSNVCVLVQNHWLVFLIFQSYFKTPLLNQALFLRDNFINLSISGKASMSEVRRMMIMFSYFSLKKWWRTECSRTK